MKEYGIMEIFIARCGRRTGNRKLIWSGLKALVSESVSQSEAVFILGLGDFPSKICRLMHPLKL